MTETCSLLDVNVHRIGLDELIQSIGEFVESRRPHQIVTVNLDFVRLARHDQQFRAAVNEADLAVPDGMPLVWLSRLGRQPLLDRITGMDLMTACAELAAARGYSFFLLGAAPGVAHDAAVALLRRHPGLRIGGTYAPPLGPFSADEDARMLAVVRETKPDFLFVAFGAPRQEIWLRTHLRALDVPVCAGVGGTFNFLAGRLPRAPQWLQRSGLEWAYRLAHEPRRLWRRYLIEDAPVLLRLLASGLFATAGAESASLPAVSPEARPE